MTAKGVRSIAVISAALLIGAAWFQAARTRIEADLAADARRHGEAVAALRLENRELQAALRAEAGPPPAAIAPAAVAVDAAPADPLAVGRAERNREMLKLVQSGLIGQVSYAAPSQFKISTKVNKLAEVLGLNAGETTVLLDAAEAVAGVLLAGAQVKTGENEIQIELRDTPEARAELARMRETFRQVLGDDGYAIYEAMGFRTALENSLSNLGLSQTAMTVTRTFDEATATTRYSLIRPGPTPVLPGGGVALSAPSTVGTTFTAGGGRGGGSGTAGPVAPGDRVVQSQANPPAARGAVAVGGRGNLTRETLANTLGPVDVLIPPGF